MSLLYGDRQEIAQKLITKEVQAAFGDLDAIEAINNQHYMGPVLAEYGIEALGDADIESIAQMIDNATVQLTVHFNEGN